MSNLELHDSQRRSPHRHLHGHAVGGKLGHILLGHQLPQDDAEGPDVGLHGGALLAEHFGSRPQRRPGGLCCHAGRATLHQAQMHIWSGMCRHAGCAALHQVQTHLGMHHLIEAAGFLLD